MKHRSSRSDKLILMIRPWIEDFSAYDHFSQHPRFLSLAALFRSRGFRVRYIDCLARVSGNDRMHRRPDGPYREERISRPAVFGSIPRYFKRFGIAVNDFRRMLEELSRAPDVVLVTSGMTYWYSGVQAVIREVRRCFGSVPVGLGGVYAALVPEHAERFAGADAVFSLGFQENFRNWLVDVCDISIPPIPEELPPPAWDLVPDLRYVVIRTSTGCDHACAYCAATRLESRFKPGPPARVQKMLLRALASTGVKDVVLYDDDVGYGDHFKNVLKWMAEIGMDLTWHLPNAVSAQAIDSELARLMRRAGVAQPRLSLNHLDRRMTENGLDDRSRREIETAMTHLSAAGYAGGVCSMYLVAGMPGQTLRMLERSAADLLAVGIKPYLAQYSPVPGTPLGTKRLESLGYFESGELFLTNKILSVYRHPGWSPNAYQELVAHLRNTRV